jgi:hypothetical protein
MPVSLEEQVKRLTAVVLNQGARLGLMDTATRSLLVTHPRPERLRATFEAAGRGFLDLSVNSRIPEEALEDARRLFQEYLALIDKAPRDTLGSPDS